MSKGRKKKSESIIVLDDQYAIKPDTHQWQLCKAVQVKGEVIFQPFKYGTLRHLMRSFVDLRARESNFNTLAQLAANIEDIKDEVEDILLKNGLNQ